MGASNPEWHIVTEVDEAAAAQRAVRSVMEFIDQYAPEQRVLGCLAGYDLFTQEPSQAHGRYGADAHQLVGRALLLAEDVAELITGQLPGKAEQDISPFESRVATGLTAVRRYCMLWTNEHRAA